MMCYVSTVSTYYDVTNNSALLGYKLHNRDPPWFRIMQQELNVLVTLAWLAVVLGWHKLVFWLGLVHK